MQRRIELDSKGALDEVVSDRGGHLERMDNRKWFLSLENADGSSVAIWIDGRVTMFEERAPTGVDTAMPERRGGE